MQHLGKHFLLRNPSVGVPKGRKKEATIQRGFIVLVEP